MGHTENGFVWMELLKNTEYPFINSYHMLIYTSSLQI